MRVVHSTTHAPPDDGSRHDRRRRLRESGIAQTSTASSRALDSARGPAPGSGSSCAHAAGIRLRRSASGCDTSTSSAPAWYGVGRPCPRAGHKDPAARCRTTSRRAAFVGTVLFDAQSTAPSRPTGTRTTRIDELIVSAHPRLLSGRGRPAAMAAEAADAPRLQNAPANEENIASSALADRAPRAPGLQVEVWGWAEIEAADGRLRGRRGGHVSRSRSSSPCAMSRRGRGRPAARFRRQGRDLRPAWISIKPKQEDARAR